MNLFDDIPPGSFISQITPLPNDPNLRRIRVGRKIVATLRITDIERLNLKIGQTWSATVAARVDHAILENRARAEAMKMLGRRPYSAAEIIDRLLARGHLRSIAKAISDELAQAGWVDDARLADAVVHHATRTKPAGTLLLRKKLAARRIARDKIEQSLAQRRDMNDESSAAFEFAKSKLRRMTNLPNRTIQRRLAGVLARRGFDDDTIAAVLEQLQLCDPDSD